MSKIAVIGAGAWGTALAQTLAAEGREVVLWAREEDVVRSVNDRHENALFLPGIKLNPKIRAVDSLSATARLRRLIDRHPGAACPRDPSGPEG